MQPVKLLVPVALFLLAASFLFKHYLHLSDVADGFIKGLSIGLLIIAIMKSRKVKHA